MSDPEDRFWWFPLKRYGVGWGPPICWQGWAVLVGYLFLLLGPKPFLPKRLDPYYAAYAVALTVALLVVCWTKGEPLHRRGRHDL
jgi:hypothetical protein